MKRANGKNQQGTVLLAVVCMGMFCITLATVALSLVNYNNGATARNVMRTQAKVTAEACLAEFIGGYDISDQDDCKTLKLLANGYTESSPRVIKVNPGNSTFESNYGSTEIHIYKEGSNAFRIASVCTFGGEGMIKPQTQTASVKFASATVTPQVTSSALECSDGMNTPAGTQMDIEGDVVLERKRTGGSPEPDKLIQIGVNSGNFKSHVYSEYSLVPANGGTFSDVWNKSGTTTYEPNATSGHGDYFQQAPVMWTDGYLGNINNCAYIYTEVGKTDKALYNRYTNPTGYQDGNLENMDGFIYAGKQIMLTGAYDNKFYIGYDASGAEKGPIDVYCHGFYYGQVNQNVSITGGAAGTQLNGHYTSAANVKYTDGGSSVSLVDGGPASQDMTINGNLYCYDDGSTASNPYNKSGDLWVLETNGHGLTVKGDLYVQNDIIVSTASKLTVTGKLHLGGSIYVVDMSSGTMQVNPINCGDVSSTSGIIDGSSIAGHKPSAYVSAAGYDKTVAASGNTDARNDIPTDGYVASTGVDSPTRTRLKDTYKNATTNCIFRASLDSGDPNNSFAKDIGAKYAEALCTPLDSHTKINYGGSTVNLVKEHSGSTTGEVIYEILGSCRFKDQNDFGTGVNPNQLYKYVVKLKDKDVVIALPVNSAYNDYPLLFVDSTERAGDVFVYIMYYDPTKISSAGNAVTVNDCMYLSQLDPDGATYSNQQFTVSGISAYDSSSHSFVTKSVTFKASDDTYRNGVDIKMNSPNMMYHFLSDLELYTKYTDPTIINEDEIISYFTAYVANDATDNVYNNVQDSNGAYQNKILTLVPDDSTWELNNHTRYQSIVYAPGATVSFHGNNSRVYGKVKCKSFVTDAEYNQPAVVELPEAAGSIMDFLGAGSSSVTEIQMQFYEY